MVFILTLPSGASKLIALGAVHVHSRRKEEISRQKKEKNNCWFRTGRTTGTEEFGLQKPHPFCPVHPWPGDQKPFGSGLKMARIQWKAATP